MYPRIGKDRRRDFATSEGSFATSVERITGVRQMQMRRGSNIGVLGSRSGIGRSRFFSFAMRSMQKELGRLGLAGRVARFAATFPIRNQPYTGCPST